MPRNPKNIALKQVKGSNRSINFMEISLPIAIYEPTSENPYENPNNKYP